MKQEGWQIQRTKEGPCQSTYFVARPAGFGQLLQQPENSVPDNFTREMKIFTNRNKVTTLSACLPAEFTTQYWHLQLTEYYRFLSLCQLAELGIREVKVLLAHCTPSGVGEYGEE